MRRRNSVVMLTVLLAAWMLSGCVLATARTLDEDDAAKAGFSPEDYVDEIWESRVIPTYEDEAVDFATLLDAIRADQDAAITQYGHRSGTGAYSFMARGTGTILTFDTSSKAGLVTVDLAPEDGTPDLSLTVGPLIKISQRGTVRDAVGFIEYGDFVNQQEFAGVANAMGERITLMIAAELGAADADAIRELDPAGIEGHTVSFSGAFALDNLDDVILVPVILEVGE